MHILANTSKSRTTLTSLSFYSLTHAAPPILTWPCLHSASSDDSHPFVTRDSVWVFVRGRTCEIQNLNVAHEPAEGIIGLVPAGDSPLRPVPCALILLGNQFFFDWQQPGHRLSIPAHPGESDVSTPVRTTFTPIFHHNLTAHLF